MPDWDSRAIDTISFRIYSARIVDESIGILTGVPAGERQKDDTCPKSTVNYFVDKRLKEMAERLKGFYAEEKKEGR